MQAVSNTGRSGVLVLKVDEDDVNTVLMNTDIENDGSLKYAYDNFADAFSENILEYAFAYADIPRNQITKKQREAAQSLLKLHEIEKLRYYLEHDVPEEDWEPAFLRWYEKKGVLGEIVLHMFLKEFKNTIPLISKMYFKDSFSQEAKGFDAVHVSQDSLTLWLGETKFYKAWKTKGVVKGGIDELVEDLKKHITNASNVTSTGFSFDACMFVTEEKDKSMNKGHLSLNDIVLTSRGTLGNVALYDKHIGFENVRINSGMLIIRPKTKRLSPHFIYGLR